MKLFVFAILITMGLPSLADWQVQLDTFGWYTGRTVSEGPFSTLVPSSEADADIRPTMQYRTDNSQIKISPRAVFHKHGEQASDQDKAKFFLNDAFYQYNGAKTVSSVGLQTVVWGPAELLSPSNPIFPFQSRQKSFFYLQRGKGLVRLLWSATSNLSLMAVSELFSNQEDPQRLDQNFSANGLIRVEWKSPTTLTYTGFSFGKTPGENGFIGEYGVFDIGDGYSIYFDGRQQQGSNAYYPTTNTLNQVYFDTTLRNSNSVLNIVNLGFRIESRVDFRFEYVRNEAGYDQDQWKASLLGLTTANVFTEQNYRRFLGNGNELQRQNYLYTSIRIPDLGRSKLMTLFFRDLYSLDAKNNLFQASLDQGIGDHLNLYLETSLYSGEDQQEWTVFAKNEFLVGFKVGF